MSTLTDEAKIPPLKILSWALWDWGTQPFATVITTFVFSVYLTSSVFGTENETNLAMTWAMSIAGLFIALLAPVLGQGADRNGKRMRYLLIQTWALAILSASLWFVAPEPSYLVLGLVLLAVGNVIAEIANVNYYAAIEKVSTNDTVGRVSGLGWGLGYLGGISVLVLIVAVIGVDSADQIRLAMVLCGAWTFVFTIPIFVAIKDRKVENPPPPRTLIQAYRDLFSSLKRTWQQSRHTIYFLIASALFRDGLAGVFVFGGLLAAGTFNFSFTEVVMFGIAANITAGVSTILFGLLDDKLGPKTVIIISLLGLVICSLLVFFLHDGGKAVFWSAGLALTLFVGPAQSASRSFLARIIPEGKSGELFGLYATTGRAVSFLSPALFGSFIWLGSQLTGSDETQYFGILGVTAVLLAGLLAILPVKQQGHELS